MPVFFGFPANNKSLFTRHCINYFIHPYNHIWFPAKPLKDQMACYSYFRYVCTLLAAHKIIKTWNNDCSKARYNVVCRNIICILQPG